MLLIRCHGGGGGSGGRNGKVNSIVPVSAHHIQKPREKENSKRVSRSYKVVDNMKICEWQRLIWLKFCEWYLMSAFYIVRDAGSAVSFSPVRYYQ